MAATISWAACAAEFIAMVLFVIIGCGSAMGIANAEGSAWVLQVALTFGFAITSLAYSIGHFSGGHINCAVTLGLVLTGNCPLHQGLANFAAQMLGSVTGAAMLCLVYPAANDRTGGLGSNGVGEQFKWHNAMIGEAAMTFLLVYVVLETACNPKSAGNRAQACLAIGFAVFLAHCVLIPIDGCSINPTRSFGPAVLAQLRYEDSRSMDDMWIFWTGPLLGAAAAAGTYEVVRRMAPSEPAHPPKEVEEREFTQICGEQPPKGAEEVVVDLEAIQIEDGSKEKQRPPAGRPGLGACGGDACGGQVSCCLFFKRVLAQ